MPAMMKRWSWLLLTMAAVRMAHASGKAAYELPPDCLYQPGAGVPAKIIGTKRVELEGLQDCSNFGQCRPIHPYLLPGDEVLMMTGAEQGGVCVRFSNGKAQTIGRVPRKSVAVSRAQAHWPLSAWAGHWEGYGPTKGSSDPSSAAVDLSVSGAEIRASGLAVNGGQMSDHVGELTGAAVPIGDRLVIRERDVPGCAVTFELKGHYLDVEDAGGCGPRIGGNFTGLYVRSPAFGDRRSP